MTLLTSLWHGGLLLLPIIGFAVAFYCGFRFQKTKSLIPLGVGLFFLALSLIGIGFLIADL